MLVTKRESRQAGSREVAGASSEDTMCVVNSLKSEHQLIVLGLAVMENICRGHDSGDKLDPVCFEQMVVFFREFADQFHHAKEEDILFRAMEQDKVRDESDMIGSLTAEHTLGRVFLGSMTESISEMRSNEDGAAADLVESARCYLTLLLHHICRENSTLCPLVEEQLTHERLTRLAEKFAQTERNSFPPGMREQCEKAIEGLRARYGTAEEILKLCPAT